MISRDRSKEIYEKYNRISPGGIHSNIRFFDPHPIYFTRAKGPRIWDVDGNEYIDCVINMAGLILGHADPKVIEAVKAQVESGLTCGVESELSLKVSEMLAGMIPCAECVRLSNTGTEAVMKAIMLARAFTGRDSIMKLEGGYDGWYDSAMVSVKPDLRKAGRREAPRAVPEALGILNDAVKHTLVMPFNDLDAAMKLIKRNRRKLAAVIVEPIMFNVGCALPKNGYLKGLKEITEANDVLLIFDEVISGFRVAPGGAQEYFGVKPDLATFAKAIANGFPLSAVAGREDIMRISAPGGKTGYAGVYNGSHVSLAAASATLEQLKDGHVQKYLNDATVELMKGFNSIAEELGVNARLQGLGGQFQVYFTDREVVDFRSAMRSDTTLFRAFQRAMLNKGFYFLPLPLFHHGISYAHQKPEIEAILKAMRASLEQIKASF
jgi:glutamate-1-semialdehyde 2,1-aminomutase